MFLLLIFQGLDDRQSAVFAINIVFLTKFRDDMRFKRCQLDLRNDKHTHCVRKAEPTKEKQGKRT